MRNLSLLLAAGCAGCGLLHSSTATAPADARPRQPDAPRIALGTFDSRVLAIAYYRSDAFARSQSARMAEYERAQAAGDAAATADIEREMEERQRLVHRQGFGAAPIPELLALIEDGIPQVAGAAGVQAVVSKWDLVWQEQDTSTTDLSLALAELFAPDEATRRLLPGILKQKPVPLDELERHGQDR